VRRTRIPITLDKLSKESIVLKSMVAELIGDAVPKTRDSAKPSHWSRRFAASGKDGFAPRILLS